MAHKRQAYVQTRWNPTGTSCSSNCWLPQWPFMVYTQLKLVSLFYERKGTNFLRASYKWSSLSYTRRRKIKGEVSQSNIRLLKWTLKIKILLIQWNVPYRLMLLRTFLYHYLNKTMGLPYMANWPQAPTAGTCRRWKTYSASQDRMVPLYINRAPRWYSHSLLFPSLRPPVMAIVQWLLTKSIPKLQPLLTRNDLTFDCCPSWLDYSPA